MHRHHTPAQRRRNHQLRYKRGVTMHFKQYWLVKQLFFDFISNIKLASINCIQLWTVNQIILFFLKRASGMVCNGSFWWPVAFHSCPTFVTVSQYLPVVQNRSVMEFKIFCYDVCFYVILTVCDRLKQLRVYSFWTERYHIETSLLMFPSSRFKFSHIYRYFSLWCYQSPFLNWAQPMESYSGVLGVVLLW